MLPVDPEKDLGETSLREYYRIAPLKLQRYLWDLEIQGNCVELKKRYREEQFRPFKKRNSIYEFSRKSRFRLLKFMQRVDWSQLEGGKWITLTYGDTTVPDSVKERNTHRYLFHRAMEKHLAEEIPMVWRVEWKRRRSGVRVGEVCPHMHFIAFKAGKIDRWDIREMWRDTIHQKGALCTDAQTLVDAKHVQIYITKYAAKVAPSPSLDSVPYLNNTGRHYGYTRKALIPMMPKTSFADVPLSVVHAIRRIALHENPKLDLSDDKGLTLLFRTAEKWGPSILQKALDAGAVAV